MARLIDGSGQPTDVQPRINNLAAASPGERVAGQSPGQDRRPGPGSTSLGYEIPTTPCVLHVGRMHPAGYGVLYPGGGKTALAHRYAWESVHGPIPKGLFVMHKCDVRACTNVDHLMLGTRADNSRDMWAKGRGRSVISNAKLTAEQVAEIRRRIAAGERTIDLAPEFGVSASNISHITARRSWRRIA